MVASEIIVQLNISAASYERLYRGEAHTVMAHDMQGRRVRFPAAALRRFVTREGIRGVFVLRVDVRNKLLDIRRCEL